MRTLHIFGDSFTQNFDDDWIWTKQLATKLKVDKLANDSSIGVSNDWIFGNVRKAILEQRLLKDDTVVVVVTSPYRYWFFKDKPELSNYMITNWDEFATDSDKSITEAIKGYVNHIQRDELDLIRTEFQVGWLKQMRSQIGFDLLLIPGFTMTIDFAGIINVLGDLTGSVSNAEFVSPDDDKKWYKQGIDTRYNHLCKVNHGILADKCVNSLMTGTTLDLCIGFKRHILRSDERETSKEVGPSLIPKAKKLQATSNRYVDTKHWLTGDK